MKDLEGGLLEYEITEEFLADIKKFGEEDKETVKVEEARARREDNGRICVEV